MTPDPAPRPIPRHAAAAALALAGLLAGCAGPAGVAGSGPGTLVADAGSGELGSGGREGRASALPPDPVRVAGVPFVAQPDWQCGPASLAMVLAAAGREVPLERLVERTFVPGLHGSLQAEMLAAARGQRMLATELPPTLAALRAELADGRPVVVLQNLGLPVLPRWHYAVLIGIDPRAGEVVLHSGDAPAMPMRLSVFERTWSRAGGWAFVVTPPDRIPASADEQAALHAVAGLERVDAAASSRAWDALVARWPGSRVGHFGRGNRLLADGDPRGAIGAYRMALAIDPGFADGWNNLAHALASAGRPEAARLAADRAVAIGGRRADAYRETQASLGR